MTTKRVEWNERIDEDETKCFVVVVFVVDKCVEEDEDEVVVEEDESDFVSEEDKVEEDILLVNKLFVNDVNDIVEESDFSCVFDVFSTVDCSIVVDDDNGNDGDDVVEGLICCVVFTLVIVFDIVFEIVVAIGIGSKIWTVFVGANLKAIEPPPITNIRLSTAIGYS